MNKKKYHRPAWRIFVSRVADKFMDAGNLIFGALIVGQMLDGQPFNWGIALLGFATWIGFYLLSLIFVYLGRGDE